VLPVHVMGIGHADREGRLVGGALPCLHMGKRASGSVTVAACGKRLAATDYASGE